jgi:hypothetical protein
MTTLENTLYHGYEYPRTDKVCIDCGMPHTCSLTKVCEVCNEIRKMVYEDRIQDDLERMAEEERDHRETIQSILNDMHPF